MVGEHLIIFEMKNLQILMFKRTFRSQYQWLDRLIKQVKNDISHDQQDKGFKRYFPTL